MRIGEVMADTSAYFTVEEVKTILQYLENRWKTYKGKRKIIYFRDYLLIRLLWITGARIGELVGRPEYPEVGLRVRDIDFLKRAVRIRTLKRKGHPVRVVPVDTRTMDMLSQYIRERDLALDDMVFGITRQRAWQIIREVTEKVGIVRVGNQKPHPHTFRHSSAIYWVKHVKTFDDVIKLKQRLGHSKLDTTMWYLRYTVEEQREVVDTIFNF